MKTRPESLIPILYSESVRRSVNYYKDVLGFEEAWEWDNPATFGGVNWGNIRIFFCKQDQGKPGTWLCINMENVDEYYDFIKDRGAKILSTPENMPWQMREMLVQDPDGHIIRFGHNTECD
jgi:catechol 2,3-dioxygenase-like lactoylglutathione lyase family enzyme